MQMLTKHVKLLNLWNILNKFKDNLNNKEESISFHVTVK